MTKNESVREEVHGTIGLIRIVLKVYCRDFPRSYRDPPTRTYPSGTDPPEPPPPGPDLDPILT